MVTCSLSFNLPLRVLTIESVSRPLSALVDALTRRGYRVEHQSLLEIGLSEVEATLPDLLLIDLQSVGSRGYELCRQLRQVPALQDITVCMVGSALSRVQSVLALRSGANDYLCVPLQIEECLLRVERQLQVSQCVRALRSQNADMAHQLQYQARQLRQYASLQTTLAQKNRQLEQLAYLDGLTGVANRLSFTQKLDETWSIMARTRQPLSLILCDVDHFKGYNDTYGHLEGDRCLQMIGEVLTQVARRRSDWVARYGGEEFVVLLPATDAEGAQQVAQQIQRQLAQRQWPHSANTASPYVSMSIGVSSLYPRATLSTDVLIRMADEALYAAKLQGRNRILTANSAYLQQPEGLSLSGSVSSEADPQPIEAESQWGEALPESGEALVKSMYQQLPPTADTGVLRVGS
ncbi:MAG: diguanylate cyclase [Cyanobacteria bacterium J06632_22]